MAKGYRKYSQEFKDAAAREVVERSRTLAEVCNEVGVHDGTLRSWVRAYRERRPAVLAASGLTAPTDDQLARLRQLERENRELREREVILKKAAAFFAQDSL